jgi:hypothetical protein
MSEAGFTMEAILIMELIFEWDLMIEVDIGGGFNHGGYSRRLF